MSNPAAFGTYDDEGKFEGVYIHWSPSPEEIESFVEDLGSLDTVKHWVADYAQEGGFSDYASMRAGRSYDDGVGRITSDPEEGNYVHGHWVVGESPVTPEILAEIQAEEVTEDYPLDEALIDFCSEHGVGFLVKGTNMAVTYVSLQKRHR